MSYNGFPIFLSNPLKYPKGRPNIIQRGPNNGS